MFLSPREILDHISVPAGARVGDFGTGAGHYALGVLERAGTDATVYAFDALASVVEKLERASRRYPGRLYGVVADLNRHIPLADDLLQFSILANILHALSEREQFLSELARVTRPGGRALVIDWTASFRNMGPTVESAVTPSEAIRLMRSAGFSTGEMLPAGSHHYAFVATLG